MLKHHFRFEDASFIRLPQFISPGPQHILLGMAPGASEVDTGFALAAHTSLEAAEL